ncbi:MAG: hypothetical protein M3P40_08535 [Actinomycetota bacterium]|nr:hypothetical protein [Actinomycetota bacterium]
MKRAYPVLLACLALSAGACGKEATEASKVADAYNALVEAVADGDYETACERLTERTRQDLEKAGQIQNTDACDDTLEQVIADVGTDKDALSTVAPSDVRIDSKTRAVVNDVRMSKAGDEWLVEGDLDFVRPFLSGPGPER